MLHSQPARGAKTEGGGQFLAMCVHCVAGAALFLFFRLLFIGSLLAEMSPTSAIALRHLTFLGYALGRRQCTSAAVSCPRFLDPRQGSTEAVKLGYNDTLGFREASTIALQPDLSRIESLYQDYGYTIRDRYNQV
jgi:hypothetical protein